MDECDDDVQQYRITPKGYLTLAASDLGIGSDESDMLWDALQAGCMRIIRQDFPDAEFAGLVFDGGGGVVVPVERGSEDDQ